MLVLVFLICSHYRVLEMREATLPLCTIIQCSNNSAMFLARENNKSKTYLQLMSFIQMTKTTNIYIYIEDPVMGTYQKNEEQHKSTYDKWNLCVVIYDTDIPIH
jgi:hypothetical protein